MILEIKPEQKKILERAAKSGMSPDEVLDQAFAAQIAEGFAQAERGELLAAEEAMHILRYRRSLKLI